ncbi:MAG: Uma2 family endonuclease [Planctomycetes bacterium]|nr:Uma2 family endonuclease [Planctomycetota bacterium]
METFLIHNQVKQAYNLGIGIFLLKNPTGRFVPDRTLYTNFAANVSTEPDGLYAHWETWKSGRLRLIPGKEKDYTELEGVPDMVLEIVSNGSVKKDTITLRELYAKAQIPEYWLVDVRTDVIRFDILRLNGDTYQAVVGDDGWIRSDVFDCSFQLVREIDPMGQPQFFVKVKP